MVDQIASFLESHVIKRTQQETISFRFYHFRSLSLPLSRINPSFSLLLKNPKQLQSSPNLLPSPSRLRFELMEGRDSSPDEDASISAAAALAKDAALLFQNRRYSECIDVLKQLLLKKEKDPKVLHNICVAECFCESCNPIDPKNLLQVLEKVKKQCEELAQASKEQSESTGTGGTGTGTGSRGTGTMLVHQISGSNNGIPVLADEFDTSVITLNIALVLYHMHEYGAALSILEPLYQNIEPIDETTALHVCFLLLDITLAIGDATKAADVIQYLEKSFGITTTTNQTDNPNTQSTNQLKISSKTNNATSQDSSDQTGQTNLTPTDIPDEEYENLISTLENLAKAPSDMNSTSTQADLKVKLQIYKVRLLLLTCNLKVAKRELKLAMNMVRGRDSSAELLLKSQLEYARGNYRKAVKLLSAPPGNRTEMFYNNLGCILHKQGNHQSANLFFNKALKETINNPHSDSGKPNLFPQDKSCIIAYNCGLQHLTSQRPVWAAQCFKEALPLFSEKPLFWVRFAECGLLALEMGLLSDSSLEDLNISVRVAGSGIYRQLIVTGASNGITGTKSDEGKVNELVSLPVARQFLVRAQLLMDISEKKSLKTGAELDGMKNNKVSTDLKAPMPAGGSNLNATLQSSVSAYEKIRKKEHLKIKQAILADLAYIDLCLKNPLKALKNAKALLSLPECSGKYLYLAHVYSAESLCLLNRPKEASEHLSVYIKGENNVELPSFEDDDQEIGEREKERDGDGDDSVVDMPVQALDASSWDPNEAKNTLYVNMGIVNALQGDVEQADVFVKQALVFQPENPRVVFANVYVDLLRGNVQEALPKLRQCRNVRFLRGNPSLDVGKSG
ncbi:hypothetical protein LUZ60_008897 [Juncus effusus]|nr:hypothetical protein LUZ60_008897 [Juncus effusus]